jgi:anti-sigma B factor antagonist
MEIELIVNEKNVTLILGAELHDHHVTGNVPLDVESQHILDDSIENCLERGLIYVLLDLKNVDYCDSTGLGVIFDANKAIQKVNGSLKVKNLSTDVARLFSITKMTDVVDVVSS